MAEQATNLVENLSSARRPILRGDSGPLRPAQVVRPVNILAGGELVAAGEFIQPPHSAAREDGEVAQGLALADQAGSEGTTVLYAAPTTPSSERILTRLGFEAAFEVTLRNLYLGVGSVSRRLDSGLGPMRDLARYAVKMRQKLIEVEVAERWLWHAAKLFDKRRPGLDFAIDRTLEYLVERYAGRPDYRMLVLRRRAGVGLDAFAIVRTYRYGQDRTAVQLVDHWTRERERKSVAWLVGELALWGVSERCDLIQCLAAAHSPLEQTLKAYGGFRKKETFPFMIKRLGPVPERLARLVPEQTQLRAGDLAHY